MTRTTAPSARYAKPDTFELMTTDERWMGFGYIGERQRHGMDHGDPEIAPLADRLAEIDAADAAILAYVAEHDWTVEELFTWANSKDGRWFADTAFGCSDLPGAMKLLRKAR